MTETSCYPITVRTTGIKLFLSVVGLLALALVLAGLAAFVTIIDPRDWLTVVIGAVLFVPLSVYFALSAWSLWKEYVVLHDDRIEKHNGFRVRELRRADIRGYRVDDRARKVRLEPNDPLKKPMPVPVELLKRADTVPWFAGLADLDDTDAAEAEKLFLESRQYGPDIETRRRRLQFWRKLIAYLLWPMLAVFFWVMLVPKPYLWAIGSAAAIPALLLLLEATSGMLRFGVEDGKKDARPPILIFLTMPALALGLRFFYDCRLLDWLPLFEWAAMLGIATAAYLALRSEAMRTSVLALVIALVLGTTYWAGVLGTANLFLDNGPMNRFPVTVLQKHKDDGTYEMKVGPWGSVTEPSKIEVTEAFYRRYREGDRVCVYRSDGWLGFSWYDLGDC